MPDASVPPVAFAATASAAPPRAGAAAAAAPSPAAARPGAVRTARIAALGTALPERRVSSAEIGARLGVDEDWIMQRTGIAERPHAAPGETLTAIAAPACERALAAAGERAADVDLVIVATFTADRLLPNAAPLLAGAIGADRAGSFDVGAACSGFISALSAGAAQIEAGRAERVLVVGADLASRFTDPEDRKTAALFADGAGAALLVPTAPGANGSGGAIGEIVMRTDAGGSELVVVDSEERLMRMQGRDTFRAAVASLSAVTAEVAERSGVGLGEIDLFVYHQANQRITRAVGERLGLPGERVVDCIERLGNSSAATIPLALEHAAADGRLRPGSRVLLGAFGAGLVWGAALLSWDGEVAR